MKTIQETFDFVVDHLYKQGIRATDSRTNSANACAYRGANGTSCAVGCLIPDEMYSSEMEGKNAYQLVKDRKNNLYDVPEEVVLYEDLLVKLQLTHDDSMPDETHEAHIAEGGDINWYEHQMIEVSHQLQEIAYRFGLKFTPPEKYSAYAVR